MPLAPADLLDMLIVDDDADTRELLAEHCAAKGFRVATAQDGRAATMALERARPPFPVVVADLHLPHADGFAVLDAARRANASCYVIMITGYATHRQRCACGAVGRLRLSGETLRAGPARDPARAHSGSHGARKREPRADPSDRRRSPRPRRRRPSMQDRLRLWRIAVAALERLVARAPPVAGFSEPSSWPATHVGGPTLSRPPESHGFPLIEHAEQLRHWICHSPGDGAPLWRTGACGERVRIGNRVVG